MPKPLGQPLLQLEGVTAGYRATEDVIREVTFDVARGEVAALVSLDVSAGKTTLLKAAAGLVEPRAGRVLFEGEDVNRMSYARDQRFRARCAVALEGGALLVNRTIWENVALPLRYHRGLWSRELNKIVERLLALCGYTEDLRAYPWQVSPRSRRLAALARALARDPDLVLVDRFFEGLEMPDWRRLFELVLELNQGQGVAWLLVSELDPAIFQVAERVAVLEAGRLIAHGFRRDLYADGRVRAAFEAAEIRPHRKGDSERILIVESSEDDFALLSSGGSASDDMPAFGSDSPPPAAAPRPASARRRYDRALGETLYIDGTVDEAPEPAPRNVHRPTDGRNAPLERGALPPDEGLETINLTSQDVRDLELEDDDDEAEGR